SAAARVIGTCRYYVTALAAPPSLPAAASPNRLSFLFSPDKSAPKAQTPFVPNEIGGSARRRPWRWPADRRAVPASNSGGSSRSSRWGPSLGGWQERHGT